MKNFKWLLNWSLRQDVILPTTPIPVYKMGRRIGSCNVTTQGNQVIGEFQLNEDLVQTDYVLYSIGKFDSELAAIILVEPDAEIEQRARKASEMQKA